MPTVKLLSPEIRKEMKDRTLHLVSNEREKYRIAGNFYWTNNYCQHFCAITKVYSNCIRT